MENKKISLTLPYPPPLNSLYRFGKGQCYMSKRGKDFKLAVEGIVLERQISCISLANPLFLRLYIYPPDLRRRDIDGSIKVIFDALERAQVYENDCQIKKLYIEMREKEAPGRVDVEIELM